MINRIMQTGVVSVALAAATLLAPAALADNGHNNNSQHSASGHGSYSWQQGRNSHSAPGHGPSSQWGSHSSQHSGSHGGRGHSSHGNSGSYNGGHGYRPSYASYSERSQALRQCDFAAERRTDQVFPGPFGRADFVGQPRVTQIGPAGFRVDGSMRVSGRYRSDIIPVGCTIRRGNVVDLDFNPASIRNDHYWRHSSRH